MNRIANNRLTENSVHAHVAQFFVGLWERAIRDQACTENTRSTSMDLDRAYENDSHR